MKREPHISCTRAVGESDCTDGIERNEDLGIFLDARAQQEEADVLADLSKKAAWPVECPCPRQRSLHAAVCDSGRWCPNSRSERGHHTAPHEGEGGHLDSNSDWRIAWRGEDTECIDEDAMDAAARGEGGSWELGMSDAKKGRQEAKSAPQHSAQCRGRAHGASGGRAARGGCGACEGGAHSHHKMRKISTADPSTTNLYVVIGMWSHGSQESPARHVHVRANSVSAASP